MKKTLLLLTLCLGLTSCYEDGYDMTKDIDMTLKFGNDDSSLSMPISFSKEILLKNVINETAVVKHLTGAEGKEFFALRIQNNSAESGYEHYINLRALPGNFNYEGDDLKEFIDATKPAHFGKMPDFLNDPEVVLDVDNPVLLLDIQNDSPATLDISFELAALDEHDQPILDEQHQPVKLIVNDLHILPGDQHIALAEKEGEILTDYTYKYVHEDDLHKVIRKIPHGTQISIKKLGGTTTEAFTDKKLRVNFGIYVPLKFREDLKIIYDYQESSVTDMLKDFEKVDVKTLTLHGEVDSNLPLDLHLDLVPVNAKGEPVEDLEVVGNCDFKPLDTNRHLSLALTPTGGTKLQDHFGKSDSDRVIKALKLRAVATAGQNPSQLLYTDTYIKINKARLTMEGGIIVDAN